MPKRICYQRLYFDKIGFMIVGLTGGIGSGKSTVAEIFKWLGIPCYNSDQSAKELMQNDPELMIQIKNLLGNLSYYPDGRLNRKWIAQNVFSNTDLLKKMNQLVHPAVFKDFESWCNKQNSKYVIKESALLIETLAFQKVDQIICVSCPLNIRIDRIIQRDAITKDEIMKRIHHQMTPEELESRSDYIIYNDGNHSLIRQVLKTHFEILNFAHHK